MLSKVKEMMRKKRKNIKNAPLNPKEKMEKACNRMVQRGREMWDSYIFWIKGSDTGETFMCVLRLTVSIGTFLLVVSLMGLSVHHVVKVSNQIANRGKETQTVNEHILTEQYTKLAERVEELTKKQPESIQGKQKLSEEKIQEEMIREEAIQKLIQKGKDGKNGVDGLPGANGMRGEAGTDGVDGLNGRDGTDGKDGKSAYAQAVDAGFTGSEEEFAGIMSNVGGNLQSMSDQIQKAEENLNLTKEDLTLTKEDLVLTKDILTTTSNQLLDIANQFRQHNTEMQQKISDMQVNFQNGCNVIAAAITAKGVDTPVNTAPQTMADNIYKLADQKYNQGVTDGMASAMENVQVEYEYHYHEGDRENGGACYGDPTYHNHSSMCYGVCPDSHMVYYGEHKDGNEKRHWDYKCGTCGYTTQPWESYGDSYFETHTSCNPRCGYGSGQFLGREVICGYEDGQILSAKITY